jgi:hypothetical protein
MFGDDRLVKNPDLVNDPKIAADMIPVYMQMNKRSIKDLEDINQAIKAIGTGSKKSEDLRKVLSKKYMTELNSENNQGSQIQDMSIDNAETKKLLRQQSNSQPVVVNNTTNVLNKETTVAPSSDRGSDNPQYKRQ